MKEEIKQILEKSGKELTNAEKKEIKQEAKEIIKKEEENNKNKNNIKEELTKEEKVSNFFDNIEFLSLNNEDKEEVALKVKKDASGDKLYWIEIFLSSSIATLGLLQNSVAVIIGAMLIAPLLRPINGLGFSIARGAHKFFIVSFRVMFLSVVLSIFMGYIISLFVGLNIETLEITSRISPNIIDFFIAIFSAMVAVMSLRFTRLGESIAGVAMAASLMPPLAVVGIELAMSNFSSALGALTLFLTNLVAIIIVGTIFFWLYGFTPHAEKLQKNVFKRLSFVIISIIIIMIPLVSSFMLIRERVQIEKQVGEYLNNTIGKQINHFSISNIDIKKINDERIILNSTIKIPENENIDNILKEIDLNISKEFGKTIEMDLEIDRVINILSK